MRWSKYPAYSVSGLYSSGYDRTVTHVGPLADEIMNTSSAIGGGTNAGRFWGYWDISSELPFGATITQIDINLTDTATYRAGVGDKYTGGNLMVAVTTVDSTWNETIVVSAESGRAFNAGVKTLTLSNLSIACDGSQTIRFKAHAEMFGDFPNYTSPGNGILKLNSVVITFNY
jgi:hypothetical protein